MDSMHNIHKRIINRPVITIAAVAVQITWVVVFVNKLSEYYFWATVALRLLSVVALIFIINRRSNPAVKLAWTVPVLAFPLFGGIAYLLMGTKKPTKKMSKALTDEEKKNKIYVPNCENDLELIKEKSEYAYGQMKYMRDMGFPVYKNTSAHYYPIGEEYFTALLEELKKAEKFIFMEYFIIAPGYMWDSILDVLKQKAKDGVDVRLMYDDIGCIRTLPAHYYKRIRENGIKCMVFNPCRIVAPITVNNRDHRKITVIDGNVAFTGGLNLADEYINKKNRFGHWKDTGISLTGEGVWAYTMMFLNMWNAFEHTDEDISVFMPDKKAESDGYIAPYGDSPLDDEVFSENVYINTINSAVKYVYICTPYLIVDSQTLTALCLAAKRGVDVRMITPGIPDKKMVYKLTRSHYPELIESGVKIYEYTPGFIHAKSFVADDKTAIVGTINLDYRSLYLHFECGCLFYESSIVNEVKKDFKAAAAKSGLVKLKVRKHRVSNIIEGAFYAILRLIAPLL